MELKQDSGVFVLNLGDGENRFNPAWVAELDEALHEVLASPGAPLVTTASGKIYSNGLDLDWFSAHGDQAASFVGEVQDLLARLLTLPAPTVAALQGHTFAAGAMLALAHDFRLMRADRGFFCLPEVDIRIPFTPGMDALIRARLSPQSAHEAMTTGRRYGGEEAACRGIVDGAHAEPDLLPAAIAMAATLRGKDPATLGQIKQRMYAGPAAALREPPDSF